MRVGFLSRAAANPAGSTRAKSRVAFAGKCRAESGERFNPGPRCSVEDGVDETSTAVAAIGNPHQQSNKNLTTTPHLDGAISDPICCPRLTRFEFKLVVPHGCDDGPDTFTPTSSPS